MKISCNDADIRIAAKAINDGAIAVFPTDTVYGLGCNPYNHDAVLSLYEIKKRKKTKSFPVIGYSKKELEKIAEFNSLEEKIAEKFSKLGAKTVYKVDHIKFLYYDPANINGLLKTEKIFWF